MSQHLPAPECYAMSDDLRFARITDAIYEAALDPALWPDVLDGVRRLLNATAAHVMYHDHHARGGSIAADCGLDPAMVLAYVRHYHALDPWAKAATPASVVAGRAILGQSLVPHADLVKTEFYADLARPFGVTRALGGQLDQATPGLVSALVVNRPDAADEFAPRDAVTMERLLPHVRRALTIHRELVRLRAVHGGLAEALDAIRAAVVLVDRRLRVHSMNAAARTMVEVNDGLSSIDGILRIAAPGPRGRLHHLVNRSEATPRLDRGGQLDDCVAVPRPSGRPPYLLVVTPLTSRVGLDLGKAAVAALFITDPAASLHPPELRLQQLFGFTPAEARIAAALSNGLAPDGIAAALGLRINTVRWHIKRLLGKTGASTQAQLVRLLLAAGTVR